MIEIVANFFYALCSFYRKLLSSLLSQNIYFTFSKCHISTHFFYKSSFLQSRHLSFKSNNINITKEKFPFRSFHTKLLSSFLTRNIYFTSSRKHISTYCFTNPLFFNPDILVLIKIVKICPIKRFPISSFYRKLLSFLLSWYMYFTFSKYILYPHFFINPLLFNSDIPVLSQIMKIWYKKYFLSVFSSEKLLSSLLF